VKTRFLQTSALVVATMVLLANAAHADSFREVKCANGRTVQASGTQSNVEACRRIASQPPRDSASGQATGKRVHAPIRARMYYDQSL
jgi:hypothetical protein